MSQETVGGLPAYPLAILRALQAVHCSEVFRQFPPSTRQVLTEIVTRLDQCEAGRPIWFKRAKVAASSGLSLRAVYLALDRLEKAGYIIRLRQPISSEGYFCCARLGITQALAELLLLPWAAAPEPAPRPSANSAASPIYLNNNLKRQPAAGTFQEIEEARRREDSPRSRPGLFQRDPILGGLLGMGLSRPAVYALMGLAKRAGQRLSEVAELVGERLRDLDSPQAVFAYLRRCLESGQDFSGRLRVRTADLRARAEEDRQRRQWKRQLAAFQESHQGAVFRSRKTGQPYRLEPHGWARNLESGGWLNLAEFFQAFQERRFELSPR